MLSLPVETLKVRLDKPGEAVGMFTSPKTPLPGWPMTGAGVLKTTLFLLRTSVVSKLGGDEGVGMLANSSELGRRLPGTVALNDWSGQPKSLKV